MISVLEFFSNSGYTFVECTVRRDDTICHTCNKQAQGSHIYFCTRHNDLQKDAACIMCKKRVVGSATYTCGSCNDEFWIHKTCAFSPLIIPSPAYHHHPLTLVYSVPDIHLVFDQYCGICHRFVYRRSWVYYCHRNENEEDDIDNDPDLVKFPLRSQESIFDLIVTQCCKSQVNFDGEGDISVPMSLTSNDPQIIEKHWSHQIHPLQLLQFTNCENDSDDSDEDRRELICDGCIQPITVFRPSYYACIQCGFFLHSFCATMLPKKLPAGALHFHPDHSLSLQMKDKFYDIVVCGVCDYSTNGFYYHCQDCDIYVDIRCAFLPTRIKHKSHKHHSLVQRPASNSTCSVTRHRNEVGVEYGCETCSSFQIHISVIIIPNRMEHKYDAQPLTLRYPPFLYEGAFYCEICEERVSNQELLYHCSESEHSYHFACGFSLHNVKLEGTIKVLIADKPHTLALVFKRRTRKKSIHTCSQCFSFSDSYCFLLECDGCGLLSCLECPLSGKLQQIALL